MVQGAGVGYAVLGCESVIVFVQATVVVYLSPADVEVKPTTLGCPSQSVIKDVTCVAPGFCRVSVNALENVEVLTMSLVHCQDNEALLHAVKAILHLDAYSGPDPVLSKAGALVCCADPLSIPSPEAT